MESLPRGANFRRAKLLWELGLSVAGNPNTPYGGPRDVCIAVGNGSGYSFRPALRMATGSPILAHAVAEGSLEMAMVNPSSFLTQAYRGVGLFDRPLPLRVIGIYPTLDQFVFAIHPRTGLRSLAEVKEKRYPLQVSVKEDPTHSTRVMTDQVLAYYGYSLADIESWGGRLHMSGWPSDPRRMEPMRDGTLDAIFDEALVVWFDAALAAGMAPIELEADAFAHIARLGWKRVVLPAGFYPHLAKPHACVDYSGWPLYAAESLPDQLAYDVCAGFAARLDEIVWEDTFTGIEQLGRDTDATPNEVPLHPGAERWFREHARG
jgi:TRAP-type uncharacterized transport system substrate-binding protein